MNLPGSSVSDTEWVPIERTLVDGRIEGDQNAPVSDRRILRLPVPVLSAIHARNRTVGAGISSWRPAVRRSSTATSRSSDRSRSRPPRHPSALASRTASGITTTSCSCGREPRTAESSPRGNLKDFARELQEVHSDFDLDEFDSCLDSGRMRSTVEANDGRGRSSWACAQPRASSSTASSYPAPRGSTRLVRRSRQQRPPRGSTSTHRGAVISGGPSGGPHV